MYGAHGGSALSSIGGTDSGWTRDYKKIIQNLHVVDNNGPDRVGGGGKPLVPLAASLAEAGR